MYDGGLEQISAMHTIFPSVSGLKKTRVVELLIRSLRYASNCLLPEIELFLSPHQDMPGSGVQVGTYVGEVASYFLQNRC